jgi:Mrp family chromosome partitioning ATPase
MATFGPERYGELVAFLSTLYEVILLDLGTGVAGPLARFAVECADQLVLVTTPEWVTSTIVLEALAHLSTTERGSCLTSPICGPVTYLRSRTARRDGSSTSRDDGALRTTRSESRQARRRRLGRPRSPDS